MKFALFLILFVGLIFAAQARSNVLDDLFLSSVTHTSEVDLALSCNQTDNCAGKGDDCSGIYLIDMGGCSKTNSSCCAIGLFCINSTCVTDTVGDFCTKNSQCVSSSPNQLNCINNTCTFVYLPGDSCSGNSDCVSGNCTGSICQGQMMGEICNTFPSEANAQMCNFGLWCMPNATNPTVGVCENRTASGQNCTIPAQCMEGTTCFSSTNDNGTLSQAMCQTIGTQSTGNPCIDSFACDSGDVCINGNCTTLTPSIVSCTLNSNCTGPNSQCTCSVITGELYCTGSEYSNTDCSDEGISLMTCLANNKCTEPSDAPNSCCYASCLSEYKKAISCGCSASDTINGGCVYSQYCGGFPVWAIIVIIVVAIVLVLAIVLLVFFMMRRRRQYDSI